MTPQQTPVENRAETVSADPQSQLEADPQENLRELEAAEQQEAGRGLRTTDGYRLDEKGNLENRPVKPVAYYQEEPRFGFTRYAEILNGRAAMVGFAIAIAIELVSGQGVLHFWNIL
jgi:hypothetical protein